jgi:spore germination protein GerM
MEYLNAGPYRNPNFKLAMLVIICMLLLLSIWIVAYRNTIDKTLLASSISLTTEKEVAVKPIAARVQASSLELALETVLKGPTTAQEQAGVFSEIPKGTHLLGYSVKNNVVAINLSKEFRQGAGATSAIERVEELKKTVRQVNPNYRLKIAVEGKPLRILTSDGLELDQEI